MEVNLSDYRWPAEWEPHDATLVAWPVSEDTWPGVFPRIPSAFASFIAALARFEPVLVLAGGVGIVDSAAAIIDAACGAAGSHFDVQCLPIPVNDSWCRDYGPIVLTRELSDVDQPPAVMLDWEWNSWGGRYPPWDLDALVARRLAALLDLPSVQPGVILEGGAIEGDGDGTVLTTETCLLNSNRNSQLNLSQTEQLLRDYLRARHVVWVPGEGILGDDTDGHVDQLARFVDPQHVLVAKACDADAPEAPALRAARDAVDGAVNAAGLSLQALELTMPRPAFNEGQRLPMSYCNFCLVNGGVIMPLFRDPADDVALQRLQDCFPDRTVVGVDARDLVAGLGSFHCLSQQFPAGTVSLPIPLDDLRQAAENGL